MLLLLAALSGSALAADPGSLLAEVTTSPTEPTTRDEPPEQVPPWERLDLERMRPGTATALDVDATRARLAPYRERLRTTLALPGWHGSYGRPFDPVLEAEALLGHAAPLINGDGRNLVPMGEDEAIAARYTTSGAMGGLTWTRSRYKVARQEDRTVAVAFGVQRASRGRGVAYTSTDIVVLFDQHDRVSEVFATTVFPYGMSYDERHLKLEYDARGQVVRVVDQRLLGKVGSKKRYMGYQHQPGEGYEDWEATRQVWTRS